MHAPSTRPSTPGRKPTVGLVAHNVNDSGGMERALAELVRHALDRVDFHLVAADVAPDLRGAVRWTRIRVPQRPVPLFFSAFYAAAAAAVPRLEVDLLHTMGAVYPGPADLVSVQFCHRAFGELPADVRRVEGGRLRQVNRTLDRAISTAAERRSYAGGGVRRFAAASSGVQRELARFYPGVPASVVPNGVAAAGPGDAAGAPSRAALRAQFGYADDDVVAVFVGGDWQRKGLTQAIEGVADAVAAGASSLRLSVVGAGDAGPHEQHAVALGVGDRVRFFGFSTTPHLHLRAADVFVFPTAYEAFPLVAIEAAAAGLPIVATAVNGIEDLVDDGRSGLLVQRERGSIAAALGRLAAEPRTRQQMGAAAAGVAARYTWAAAADRTVALYAELLGG